MKLAVRLFFFFFAKSFSNAETVKPKMVCAPKIQWCCRHRVDDPIQKGEKKGGSDCSQASPKPSKVNMRF